MKISLAFTLIIILAGCHVYPKASAPSTMNQGFPTMTPHPTLSSIQQTQISGLLDNAGNCPLSCWWGIVPDKTSCINAMELLSHLTSDSVSMCDGNWTAAYFYFPSPLDSGIAMNFRIANGTIHAIYINGDIGPKYSFLSILRSLGKPDDVWIKAIDSDTANLHRLLIYMFYSSPGVLLFYSDENTRLVGNFIQGCFYSSPDITLWSPTAHLDIIQALGLFTPPDFVASLEGWKTVEDAIGIDLITFYTSYSDPNMSPCLKTPRNIW